jgi:hypothetical protein
LEPDLVSNACWVEIQDDGDITVSDVDDFQEWALGKELLDEIISEEMFWDSSFIDYAVKELGD